MIKTHLWCTVAHRCQQMTLTSSVVGKQLTNTTVTIETLPLPGGPVVVIAHPPTARSVVAPVRLLVVG
ncbi:hypothetical protein ACQPZ2_28205 [Nocardia pseudovaccinii]|uniref:hypothetical protein n=1 Tax=Nocardia pseudovaccinii TaxID=189540 RepID=UPI003D92374C